MNTSERVQYFTKGMNLKFAQINYIKMTETMKQIKRYVTREINGDKNLIVSSQEMRAWAMSLTKLLKQLQRKCEFDIFKENFNKYEKVNNDIFIKEAKAMQTLLNFAMDLQPLVLEVNYYSTIIYILEEKRRCEKEYDDGLFNDMVLSALIEAW